MLIEYILIAGTWAVIFIGVVIPRINWPHPFSNEYIGHATAAVLGLAMMMSLGVATTSFLAACVRILSFDWGGVIPSIGLTPNAFVLLGYIVITLLVMRLGLRFGAFLARALSPAEPSAA